MENLSEDLEANQMKSEHYNPYFIKSGMLQASFLIQMKRNHI